jgi:hypothetical protein
MTILGKDIRGNVPGSQAFFEHMYLLIVDSKANMPETLARHCTFFLFMK